MKYKIKQKIKFKGKNHVINLSYSNVLKAFDVLEDDFLLPYEKNLFFINSLCKTAYKIKFEDIGEFSKLISIEFFSTKSTGSAEKTVDLKSDEAYIYASFKQAYDIDLNEENLSWDKFKALFTSLPESTKIREIMSIRAKPLPIPTKYNAKEIANLIKLKEFYALNETKKGENLNDGFKSLFETLKKRVVM